ncbi:MAG: cytidylate kinase family protein [SAR324 cluster bacterium]|nr:cytidylate kinase family protein [SAR324 cluster bacterium]
MAVITITRGLHSGGEEIAESVAESLGARCVSSEVLGEAARNYNVPETKVSEVFETSPSFWERMTESRRTYVAYVQATLAEWSQDDNLVYHGNAGQELLREVPHVLKVRLLYPIPYRVRRIMDQFGQTQEQAERFVEHIDDERTKRTRYMFSADWRDPSRYDIMLRMEKIPKECAGSIILDLAARPEFRLNDEKRVKFQDFIIKARTYALLASTVVGRLSLISVTVNEGVVTLEGTLTSHEAMIDQIVEEVERLEGVKHVNNEIIVGLVYHEWNV